MGYSLRWRKIVLMGAKNPELREDGDTRGCHGQRPLAWPRTQVETQVSHRVGMAAAGRWEVPGEGQLVTFALDGAAEFSILTEKKDVI